MISERALNALSLAEKRGLLRKDEYKTLVVKETTLEEKKVSSIKPISREMNLLLDEGVQTRINDFEKGIDSIERSL